MMLGGFARGWGLAVSCSTPTAPAKSGTRPGTSRALTQFPANTRSGHHFGFRFGPWAPLIRADQHLADGYLLMADG